MKKQGKKKIIIIASVVLIAIIVFFNMFASKEQNAMVEVSSLQKGDIKNIVEVSGNVQTEDSAEITSPYNYEVIQINVKEGDIIQKGQVLALLDSKAIENEIILLKNEIKYEEQRLNEAYNSANNIYKSTESLKLNSDTAKLTLENAQKTLEDKKALLDAGAIAQNEYEQAQTSLEQAQIAYDTAQEALKKAEHDIQSQIDQATPKASALTALQTKKLSLSQKQGQLEKLKITSPINGTVTRVYAKLGRSAQKTEDNKPMFIIEDESKKYVVAKVGEYDISKVKLNQEVEISADVLGKNNIIKGTVNRISPTGEKSQSGSNIVVPVKILITENDSRLIAGVNAKAKIKIDEVKDIFKIPFDSIVTKDGKDYIFAVENNTLKQIEVKKGMESDLETQVISQELSEGMQIVKNPQDTFMDGEIVQIMQEDKNLEQAK